MRNLKKEQSGRLHFWGICTMILMLYMGCCILTEANAWEQKTENTDMDGRTEPQNISELLSLDQKQEGLDIVLVMDHSVSIRSNEERMRARDNAARLFAALCGGVESSIGVVYFAGGFLPEDSDVYLPEKEEECRKERQIMESYPQFDNSEETDGNKMLRLDDVSQRLQIIEKMIGKSKQYLADNVSTNIAVGLNQALELLENVPKEHDKIIVLFSDGKNDTREDIQEVENVYNAQTRRVVEEAKNRGIEIYSIYLSDKNNPKQSDIEQLQDIVSYYAESEEDRDRLKIAAGTEELEEKFVEIFSSITSVNYVKKEKSDTGIYTLSALQETDALGVSVIFRGDEVKIERAIKGEEILSEEFYYNYRNGSDSLCGIFLDSMDTSSTYTILTNSVEETCYQIYIHGVKLSIQEEKDRIRASLYTHNGIRMTPGNGLSITVSCTNMETGENIVVAEGLRANGDEFITAPFFVPCKADHSYEIVLYQESGGESYEVGKYRWEVEGLQGTETADAVRVPVKETIVLETLGLSNEVASTESENLESPVLDKSENAATEDTTEEKKDMWHDFWKVLLIRLIWLVILFVLVLIILLKLIMQKNTEKEKEKEKEKEMKRRLKDIFSTGKIDGYNLKEHLGKKYDQLQREWENYNTNQASEDTEILKKMFNEIQELVSVEKSEHTPFTSNLLLRSENEELMIAVPWIDENLIRRDSPVDIKECQIVSINGKYDIKVLENFWKRDFAGMKVCGYENGVCLKGGANFVVWQEPEKRLKKFSDILRKGCILLEPGKYVIQFYDVTEYDKWDMYIKKQIGG